MDHHARESLKADLKFHGNFSHYQLLSEEDDS